MKKCGMILFLALAALMITLPGLCMNRKPDQVSEIDNRKLAELPAALDQDFNRGVEDYVSDRVGFRNEMITAYQLICDKAFRKLAHPIYMYGKEGHIMTNLNLITVQNYDVDEEYVANLTGYLKSLEGYLGGRGIEFLFFFIPDKETIYPEFFPDGYNVMDQLNRSDRIAEELDKAKVPYLFLRELFLELKSDHLLYNKRFDVEHWNGTGAFYGNSQVIDYLNQLFPLTGRLEAEEFEIGTDLVQYIPATRFPIWEEIPSYDLGNTGAVSDESIFLNLEVSPYLYHMHFKNEQAEGKPKVLIIGDSYMVNSSKFYVNHCSELLMVHISNLANLEDYIDYYQPDIVIMETVERSLQVDGFLDNEAVKIRYPSASGE